jgi:hypothetical protein
VILRHHANRERLLMGGVIATCFAMLITFKVIYFDAAKTGTDAQVTYRTGEVDPKWAAYKWIQKDQAEHNGSKTILAEDWWSYWPMIYFDSPHREFTVQYIDPLGFSDEVKTIDVSEMVGRTVRGRGYLIGFVGKLLDKNLRQIPESTLHKETFKDYVGRDVFYVWRKPL